MTPEMQCLLEAMRDSPGSISKLAAAGGAAAALDEVERLRAALKALIDAGDGMQIPMPEPGGTGSEHWAAARAALMQR